MTASKLVPGGRMLADVQTAIDAITDDEQRILIQLWWDEALDFQRDHPIIVQMGAAMGLSASDLDQLFTVAKTL